MSVYKNGVKTTIPNDYPVISRDVSLTQPLVGGFAITKSDTTDLPRVTRQLYIGGAGDLAVVWADGSESVEPVKAGDRLDWRIRRVKSTGTTATLVRGYY